VRVSWVPLLGKEFSGFPANGPSGFASVKIASIGKVVNAVFPRGLEGWEYGLVVD